MSSYKKSNESTEKSFEDETRAYASNLILASLIAYYISTPKKWNRGFKLF